jgi:hypothetical protein
MQPTRKQSGEQRDRKQQLTHRIHTDGAPGQSARTCRSIAGAVDGAVDVEAAAAAWLATADPDAGADAALRPTGTATDGDTGADAGGVTNAEDVDADGADADAFAVGAEVATAAAPPLPFRMFFSLVLLNGAQTAAVPAPPLPLPAPDAAPLPSSTTSLHSTDCTLLFSSIPGKCPRAPDAPRRTSAASRVSR